MIHSSSHLWFNRTSAILVIAASMGLSACKSGGSAEYAEPATAPSTNTPSTSKAAPAPDTLPAHYASPDDVQKKHLRAEAHDLMLVLADKESDLDGILIIKSPRPETVQIVKDIAAMNVDLKTTLKKAAASDPSLKLGRPALPEPEIKTREAIEAMIRDQLIWANGTNLERRLLLTQVDAMGYLGHLTKVASSYEGIPKDAEYLQGVSDKALKLRERVIAALASLK